MKIIYCFVITIVLCTAACQKQADLIMGGGEDSLHIPGDTITYEVISTDTSGWFGVWMDEDSRLVSNQLDSITYGSPIYFHSGWKYSFIPKHQPFQALMSVDNRMFSDDITINLYKGGQLIKSVTNDVGKGFAKLIMDIDTTVVTGTATDPVLTYEVLVSDTNNTSFQSNAWIGDWTMPDGTSNQLVNGVPNPLLFDFAIPSGWHYSFKPNHLPFKMSVFSGPYTEDGCNITINFYVNHQLVKSASSRGQQRLEYTVQ